MAGPMLGIIAERQIMLGMRPPSLTRRGSRLSFARRIIGSYDRTHLPWSC